MRDDAVLRHALPLGRGLGREVPDALGMMSQTVSVVLCTNSIIIIEK